MMWSVLIFAVTIEYLHNHMLMFVCSNRSQDNLQCFTIIVNLLSDSHLKTLMALRKDLFKLTVVQILDSRQYQLFLLCLAMGSHLFVLHLILLDQGIHHQ